MRPYQKPAILLFLLLLIINASLSAQGLFNNEFMASNSATITDPILIISQIGLRFTIPCFNDGFTPSITETKTYFINEQTDLPVFSLVTNPANFFSDTSGIYVIGTNGIIGNCSTQPRNWNQDWKRPVSLEFFEFDKSLAFRVNTGGKIFGG